MQISLDDLTVSFEHRDRAALLADWEWLIGPHRLPILISAVGDAFVQDTRDGTVHQLDIVSPRVHFSLSGQLHRQIADLPEGARITGFRIADE